MEFHLIPIGLLKRLGVSDRAVLHVSLFASAVLVVLATPLLKSVPHFCLAQFLFHLPCPGCGITTGLRALLHADWRSAVLANPASLMLAAFLIFQLLARPLALLRPTSGNRISTASRYFSHAVLFTLFSVWLVRLI
jgi:hypothetical protein